MTGCPSSCNPMQRALTVVKSFNQHRKKFQPTREKALTGTWRWGCVRDLLEPTFDRATCYNHVAKCYNQLRALLQLALHCFTAQMTSRCFCYNRLHTLLHPTSCFATTSPPHCYNWHHVFLPHAKCRRRFCYNQRRVLLHPMSCFATTGTTSWNHVSNLLEPASRVATTVSGGERRSRFFAATIVGVCYDRQAVLL